MPLIGQFLLDFEELLLVLLQPVLIGLSLIVGE